MPLRQCTTELPFRRCCLIRGAHPLLGFLVCLLATMAANAQDVEVRVATEEPPHYAGMDAIVQLTVVGLKSSPEPTVKAENGSPSKLKIELSAISPRISQQIFSSGGNIRRIENVTHLVQFVVTAKSAGDFRIGPFTIEQDGKQTLVDAIDMTFREVPFSDDIRIRLVMPETAYPEQRVPVGIEWWFAGDTRLVNSLTIRSPLFDEFRFTPDERARRGDNQLPIRAGSETLVLPAKVRTEKDGDKEFTVLSAERTLIPDRVGDFDISPIEVLVKQVTRWRNSGGRPFGLGGSLLEEAFGARRQPASVELFRAEGDAFTFRVKPFPRENQPESFSGAVGDGFSVDVSADRTVVRVGDPIRLTINLNGDGNIENATPPSLSADGGLDRKRFRLPDGEIAGIFDRESGNKQFVVSVRVEDESINEIPGIAYSWFNPTTASYQTTRSKPIALRVMPASIVGADAVVSGTAGPAEMLKSATDLDRPSDSARPSSGTSGLSSDTLSGADLAIELDPERLLGKTDAPFREPGFRMACYGFGVMLSAVAFVDRRRRRVAPEIKRAAHLLKEQRKTIQHAGTMPQREGGKQIASALQSILANFPTCDRSAIESVMSRCESVAYQPESATAGQDARVLAEQALDSIAGLKPEEAGP